MNIETNGIDKDARIAVIGAGPAGLSVAWFLKKKGYSRVTILEKLGRIGGLCKSITIKGMSYDLGANYLTWAYTETLKIADSVGADTYKEKPYTSINAKGKKPDEHGRIENPYRSLKDAVLVNPFTKEKIGLWEFVVAAIRYLILRIGLMSVIDRPDYLARINKDTHPELCKTFKHWLQENKLDALATMFEFPITIMGYGQLRDIPAPYALRYMSLKTYFPMIATQLPLVGELLLRWPKRFKRGFQRMWEKVSWQLNVRLNVNIQKIHRTADGITIDFKVPRQELNETGESERSMDFDYLILACPLTPDVFERLGLERSKDEVEMSSKIRINPYCMTTYWVEGLEMPEPIAPILPLLKPGRPWAVAQQFKDEHNFFTQFYTRPAHPKMRCSNDEDQEEGLEEIKKGEWNAITKTEWDEVTQSEWDEIEDEVKKKVKELIRILGGNINESESRWHTYDRFTYFQHVCSEDIANGYYEKLEQLQGTDRTFYVGGVTDFELVEPIVQHSKHLVEKHF